MKTKIIMESWRRFLKEATWVNSPDEDWPVSKTNIQKYFSKEVILFDSKDFYGDTGAPSHGRDSHMAKHWLEFGPQIQDSINKCKQIIQNFSQQNKIYSQTMGSEEVKEISFSNVKDGDILNTYDHINDKKFDGESLFPVEKEIYDNAMMISVDPYDKKVDEMIQNGVDISDEKVQSMENLIKILNSNDVIKFKAVYSGSESTYYYNPKISSMVAELNGNVVATLYRLRNKGKDKQLDPISSIRGFNSGAATVPTNEYSLFRSLADQEINKAKAANAPKPKKKQKKQNKNQSPQDFAKNLANKGMSADRIKDIMSRKFPKIPQQGLSNLLKKAGIQ